ncbi:hypothetical protein LIER_34202 [Lithospermum erythrorhizon]|uniref:Reverse transcriptase Ty1/copia-type domain-containing protein n=1 Tax=Lithospermum erythrorhizon TaxID=34254 RepID=A0AAV3S136_LITER
MVLDHELSDPATFEEATKCEKWQEAMRAELNSIDPQQNQPPSSVVNRDLSSLSVKTCTNIDNLRVRGELEEVVYVDQPQVYVKKGMEHMVYKLDKALYGLKQTPRAWFNKIEAHFNQEGFLKCDSEQTLFTKRNSA